MRFSTGPKTRFNAAMTVGVGACSSWIVAARFDPDHYGTGWRPLALALLIGVVQAVVTEAVQTPGDRLASQVREHEETKQEIRTTTRRLRLPTAGCSTV
jgi:hypothetical protein